jgi:hypothetical protein
MAATSVNSLAVALKELGWSYTRLIAELRRHAEDPADLGSPLAYSVEVLADDDDQDLDPAAAALSKSRQWVLAALRAGGEMQTVKQLGNRLAQSGHPLKPRTIQLALGELEAAGLAQGSEEGSGRARYWSPTAPDDAGGNDDGGGEVTSGRKGGPVGGRLGADLADAGR